MTTVTGRTTDLRKGTVEGEVPEARIRRDRDLIRGRGTGKPLTKRWKVLG